MMGMISSRILSSDEVMLTHAPLFHIGGLSLMLFIVAAGGTYIICNTHQPEEIFHVIEKERVTFIFLLPPVTYYKLCNKDLIKNHDLSSVKIIQSASGGAPAELVKNIYETFPNAQFQFGWGQTESGAGTNFVFDYQIIRENSNRVHSIGKEQPFVQIKLVDENGVEVPTGDIGEAILKTPTRMLHYLNQPELTKETIKEDWLYTGDLLRKDKDGYYYFVDRKKDMIKSGGENIFALEVETVIRNHPSVMNCAVIGVPDPKYGEGVMAVIQLQEGVQVTKEEINEHCKKYLSSYKKPRYIDFVKQFPVDTVGKIQKKKLLQGYQKDLQHYLV